MTNSAVSSSFLEGKKVEYYCVLCDESHSEEQELCPSCSQPLMRLEQENKDYSGQILADVYQLQEKIGNGGMGTVYRAVDTRSNSILAIKVIEPHLAKNMTNAKRFLREAKLTSRLQNPNIVSIYNFGQSGDGMLFIAMELLNGSTLRDIPRFALGQALAVARNIAEALKVAHEAGIVHRDLKPDNVIVNKEQMTGELTVKVLDFGLAKSLEEDENGTITRSGIVLGTPNYISPELAKGEQADGRADLYSLGIMLYEMVTGHLPFTADAPPQVLALQAFAQPAPLPADTPEHVKKLILSLLEKSPEDRPQSADVLIDQIDDLLDELSVRESASIYVGEISTAYQRAESTTVPPDLAPTRRRSLGIAVALVVALACVGLLALGGTKSKKKNVQSPTSEAAAAASDVEVLTQSLFTIETNIPAEVTVDGKKLGKTPVEVVSKPQTIHSVSIEAKGYKLLEESVTTGQGKEQTFSFVLEKNAPAKAIKKSSKKKRSKRKKRKAPKTKAVPWGA